MKLTTCAFISLLMTAATVGYAEDGFRTVADPSRLKWVDTGPPFPDTQIAVLSGDPSKEGPFVMRFRCPNNYKIPAHIHPATEAVTVLQGTFSAGTGEVFEPGKLVSVGPGGFFVMPGGTPHFALCKGTTVIELHATGPWGTDMLESH